MEAFHETIRLWMETARRSVVGAQEITETSEECRGKLAAPVTDELARNAKPAKPAVYQDGGDGGGSDIICRNTLEPTGGPVYNRHQISLAG